MNILRSIFLMQFADNFDRSFDVAWMPVIDRWYLHGNSFVNPKPTGSHNVEHLIKQMNMASNGSVEVSVYGLLGFDNTTFGKSVPKIGAADTISKIGSFPSPNAERPKAVPFSGWSRWTNQSHVVKLGMIWTFPVTVDSRVAALHLSVEPGILWRYVDLYSYVDFSPNVFNEDFYLMKSALGEQTLQMLNNVSHSKVEQALRKMTPVRLVIETSVVGSPDTSETSNVKLAWLNMSDNTWVVLCNTSVVIKSCSSSQQLQASAHIDTSLFFDYARNRPDPYGNLHEDQYNAGDPWSDPLEQKTLSYYPLGFASNYSMDDESTAEKHIFTQRQLGGIACDSRLQGTRTCDGCGARFEVFNYSGCYVADGSTVTAPQIPSWTVASSPTSPFAARRVNGCDARVIPFGVPSPDTGSDSPIGYQGKTVLQAGGGFRAFFESDTFKVTVGAGLCVTPTPAETNKFVPDLVNIRQTAFRLCSDIMRLYYDAEPSKNVLVTVPIQYITAQYMAIAWYSVISNQWNPVCTNLPQDDNSTWLSIPVSTLTNPDFINGAKGCEDAPAQFQTRKARCDGFGARIACLNTDMCLGFTPDCTSEGVCLTMTGGSVQAFNGTVTLSGTFIGTLSAWMDSFQSFFSDTWTPQVTQFWDTSFLQPKGMADMYGDPVQAIRILFSSTPQNPLQISVDLRSVLSQQETRVVKLAWYNRSSSALFWTPICNSTATRDGIVSATLGPDLLTSPYFGDWTASCSSTTSTPFAKSCQKGAFLVVVNTALLSCKIENKIIAKPMTTSGPAKPMTTSRPAEPMTTSGPAKPMTTSRPAEPMTTSGPAKPMTTSRPRQSFCNKGYYAKNGTPPNIDGHNVIVAF
jgi:hypothetical protein